MPEKYDLETKKEIAKIGMTVALGLATVSAPFLKGSRLMKNLHTGSGVVLVAFGLWHHLLYQPERRRAREQVRVLNVKSPGGAVPEHGTVEPRQGEPVTEQEAP